MPIWQRCERTDFLPVFVIPLTRAHRTPRPRSRRSTSREKGLRMGEFYLTAGILVILALAVMFIISKIQE